MLPQKDGLSLSPAKVFSIFIFHLLIHLNRAESQVVGPHQPVVALVDDDVILPCHVEPAEDVTAEILEWTRSDLNPRFVHVWRSGQDLVNTRNPSYRGRASLFINELKRGNISLKLSKVKLSDEGTYECSIPLMEKKSFVKLVVASDAATSPVISLSGIDKNRGGVVLQCESAGWYPEPELLWLDGEGNLLSAGPTETLRGPDDLYTVSSRVTVEKRHSNNITCRVQQKKISQNRETHIHVPEDFFEVPSSSPSVIIGLAVCLALCIMLLISSAAVLLCRMKKHKNNRSPEDQTDVGGAEVPLRGSSPKTKNKTSCWPITWTSKLQEEQKRREEAEKNLQDIKEELQQEKTAAEDLKKKNRELSGNISQAQKEKQEMERLRNELDSTNQQLQQEKTAAEDLKKKNCELSGNISQAQKEKQKMERLRNELDSTKQQLPITSRRKILEEQQRREEAEKNLQDIKEKLYGNISQAQEEKQKMERLRNELDSTKQQLPITSRRKILEEQQRREEAEKNLQDIKEKMLQAEKTRNDESDRKLKELVKQLQHEKKKTEKNLNELVKQLEEEKNKTEVSRSSLFNFIFPE
uniref:Ig-like domain-containing protein n=1 Tax=Astatotilapia calliptera TaxID=8154 RepID=A0AAX7V5B8_ASTCA